MTLTAAWRSRAAGFGVTVYVIVALPWPLVGEPSASHSAPDRASHAHSRLTVSVIVPLPPSAATVGGVAASVTPQRASEVGAVACVEDDPPQPARLRTAAAIQAAHRVPRPVAGEYIVARMDVIERDMDATAARRVGHAPPAVACPASAGPVGRQESMP